MSTTPENTANLTGMERRALARLEQRAEELRPVADPITEIESIIETMELEGIASTGTRLRAAVKAIITERDRWEQTATSHLRYIGELVAERDALQARVDRFQNLWGCWQEAQGYSQQSKRYAWFLEAYADCERNDDFEAQPEGQI